MSFEQFGLSPEIISGLADIRIFEPTPLQQEVIPAVLQGRHLLVNNETEEEGAFLIPALHKVNTNGEVPGTRVLILTPSIERAQKIDEMVWAIGYHAQISSALLALKGNKEEQEKAVLEGAPVIIANPGRLVDILDKHSFMFQNLALIVIDEAHEMENFNLVKRVKDVLRSVEGEPQTLILSRNYNQATKDLEKAALSNHEIIGFDKPVVTDIITENPVMEAPVGEVIEVVAEAEPATQVSVPEQEEQIDEVSALTEEKTGELNTIEDVEQEPAKVEIDHEVVRKKLNQTGVSIVLKHEKKKESPVPVIEDESPALTKGFSQSDFVPKPVSEDMEQGYILVPPRMKISTLMAHLEQGKQDRIIVFAVSQRTTDRLFRIIRKKNWGVVSIHEGLDKEMHEVRLGRFTSGEMRILLVGGISARDIPVENIQQIINYDVPSDVDEYRFRAELVGGGKVAQMISLVSKMDKEGMDKIVSEVGFAPSEIPLPKEVEEKKTKNKKTTNRKPVEKSQPKRSPGSPKSGQKKAGANKSAYGPKKKVVKGKSFALPRPNYDGLSGGREGEKSGGIFGWVKKIFN